MNLFFGHDDNGFWVLPEGSDTKDYVTREEWHELLDMARTSPPEKNAEAVKLKLTLQATVEKYDGEYSPDKTPVEVVTGELDTMKIDFGSH